MMATSIAKKRGVGHCREEREDRNRSESQEQAEQEVGKNGIMNHGNWELTHFTLLALQARCSSNVGGTARALGYCSAKDRKDSQMQLMSVLSSLANCVTFGF